MSILPTHRFRVQHREITDIVDRIETLTAQEIWPARALGIRLGFGELSVKLRLHLSLEDDVLYPRLTRHADANVRNLALKYQSEMGGIGHAYEDFLAEWILSGKLLVDRIGFESALKTLFTALKDRIEREDTLVYPLADIPEAAAGAYAPAGSADTTPIPPPVPAEPASVD